MPAMMVRYAGPKVFVALQQTEDIQDEGAAACFRWRQDLPTLQVKAPRRTRMCTSASLRRLPSPASSR